MEISSTDLLQRIQRFVALTDFNMEQTL
jgi:hypothetical protein